MNQLNRQIGQLRQIAKAQQADLSSGKGRQHQTTHSTSVVVALQSKLASMTNDFKSVRNNYSKLSGIRVITHISTTYMIL